MKTRLLRTRRITKRLKRPLSRMPSQVSRDLESVQEILVRHGAQRIILYGSFARGDFRPTSDLDLCVEGMPDDQYFPAWSEVLMKINRRVSILDLKGIRGYLEDRIRTEGKTIYAAN